MAWIGTVENGPGQGPYNMFPIRAQTGTVDAAGNRIQCGPGMVCDWADPLVPSLAECDKVCGPVGFYSGGDEDSGQAAGWDDLMLYLGKFRDLDKTDFWRRILLSDEIFFNWLQDPVVRNALAKLLYEECIGQNVPIGTGHQAICDDAKKKFNDSKTPVPDRLKIMPLIFLCNFFDKADDATEGESFVRNSIYRTLSGASNVDQCNYAEKVWEGNKSKCWLCNQNITNIYIGGTDDPNVQATIRPDIDPKTKHANPALSSHSIHGKECEHCLPYIIGAYMLQLSGGNPKVSQAAIVKQSKLTGKSVDQIKKENAINLKKALKWQNLEYEWSHRYCNQIKSQGHFLDYNEETGEFGINYVQVANFSKRLRCQGNYDEYRYSDKSKKCNRITAGTGTLTEQNWKTFTDETGEIQFKDANWTRAPRFIRTSCDPNPYDAQGNPDPYKASCRRSFFEQSELPASRLSEAAAYIAAKGLPAVTFRKDTDAIIYKMKDICEALNEPIVDPLLPPNFKAGQTIGLLSLMRARVSSFIIAKYAEDIGKQLLEPNSNFNTIWSSSLPSGWDVERMKIKPKYPDGELEEIAKKFVTGFARCCQAAMRSTGQTMGFMEIKSWTDCLTHASNAGYLSLDKIGALKGEQLSFGARAVTRSYTSAAILMTNPNFVVPFLTKYEPKLRQLCSPGTPLAYLENEGWVEYGEPPEYGVTYENFSNAIKALLTPDSIYQAMSNEAESIIPGITELKESDYGAPKRSKWQNVAAFISYNFEKFIINLWLYSSPIILVDSQDVQNLKLGSDPNVEAQLYVDSFWSSHPNYIGWLEDPKYIQFLLEGEISVFNSFWAQIFSRAADFWEAIKGSGGFSDLDALIYITNYLDEYANRNPEVLQGFLSWKGEVPGSQVQVRRQSRRLQGLLPEYAGLFGKVKSRARTKSKPRAKPRGKSKSKPRGKSKSKPKGKPKSKSSDTNLKNKLKMVGIKVTKMVKGKRVSLTKKELQKRISAFKKLQARAKKLKVSLKYKSTSGRYKFKSQRRLISDIKKATKRKNTKRKNTKRKNPKRRN
jgi:hypothetical protein